MTYHMLSEFRSKHAEAFSILLTFWLILNFLKIHTCFHVFKACSQLDSILCSQLCVSSPAQSKDILSSVVYSLFWLIASLFFFLAFCALYQSFLCCEIKFLSIKCFVHENSFLIQEDKQHSFFFMYTFQTHFHSFKPDSKRASLIQQMQDNEYQRTMGLIAQYSCRV